MTRFVTVPNAASADIPPPGIDLRHRRNEFVTLRRRGFFALAASCALVAGLGTPPAVADDALAAIKARGAMTVGVKADYPPFGFLQGDKNAGLEIDLLHEIAKDMLGKPDAITFVPVVSANRFQFLNTGKLDFLFSTVTITPQRQTIVDFSTPYMKSGWRVLVPKQNIAIKDASDLAGKTVVVVPGSTGEAGLSKLVPSANLLKLTQTSEALQALDQGRADAFVQDAALFAGITQPADTKYKVVGKTYDDAPIGAACRKGDSAACDYIATEIAKFSKDGTLAREYKKWLGDQAATFLP
jgi:polar amino acid transport system substrate-binding protein